MKLNQPSFQSLTWPQDEATSANEPAPGNVDLEPYRPRRVQLPYPAPVDVPELVAVNTFPVQKMAW